MNKPQILTVIISGILLNGCQGVPSNLGALTNAIPMASVANAAATPAQKEVWTDKNGYQADFQETNACESQAKIAVKENRAREGEHKNLLNIAKDMYEDSSLESSKLEGCMLSKGYVKTTVTPDKMPPPKPSAAYAPAYGVPANPYAVPQYPSVPTALTPQYPSIPSYQAPVTNQPLMAAVAPALGEFYKGEGDGLITLNLKVDRATNLVSGKAEVDGTSASCKGSIQAQGAFNGNVLVLSPVPRTDACILMVELDPSATNAKISETNCTAWHGPKCSFNGRLDKKY